MKPEIGDIIFWQSSVLYYDVDDKKSKYKTINVFAKVMGYIKDSKNIISSVNVETLEKGYRQRIYFMKSGSFEPTNFVILGKLEKNETLEEKYPEVML